MVHVRDVQWSSGCPRWLDPRHGRVTVPIASRKMYLICLAAAMWRLRQNTPPAELLGEVLVVDALDSVGGGLLAFDNLQIFDVRPCE